MLLGSSKKTYTHTDMDVHHHTMIHMTRSQYNLSFMSTQMSSGLTLESRVVTNFLSPRQLTTSMTECIENGCGMYGGNAALSRVIFVIIFFNVAM